ncbi:hypothetical protein Prum_064970 [Phytohabitans rumicis]|uniref:Uncharacterized protein n=1 Tax=Phytohabitans rumicis TaxID=1076125 RepID=A0A6V8LJR0_9ACTN|nr:hypothetical protein Prum_064970 [Phytohabitans rumicis]
MIAALVIAPLAWLLLAFGQERSIRALSPEGTGDLVRPAVCLAAAGLLLGLLATLRFSPLGAFVAGLAYAGSYLAAVANPDGVLDAFPSSVTIAGRDADPTTPLRTGTALLLGALLLLGVVSVGRWRQWPARQDADADPPASELPLRADRPLGVDGLGLAPAARTAEPEPAWAGGDGWGAGRHTAEPDLVARHASRTSRPYA